MKTSPPLLLALLFCGGTSLLHAQQLTVIDDDMSSPGYSSFSFNRSSSDTNPDDISFEDKSGISSGGNPGGYLEISHIHDVVRDIDGNPLNGDGSTTVQSFFSNNPVDYTPSLQGGIASITFSLDYRTNDPFSTVYFGVSDPNGGMFSGFSGITANGEWQTVTVSGLIDDDFPYMDFLGPEPLKFGFGFISDTDAFSFAETYFADVDNFRVTINQVPEPSFTALPLTAFCGLLLRRCRR